MVWRQTAEFVCKYFHKGNLIAVDGSIQTRTYEDKTGNKRYAFEVVDVYKRQAARWAVPAHGLKTSSIWVQSARMCIETVSYTHLDVYKRKHRASAKTFFIMIFLL